MYILSELPSDLDKQGSPMIPPPPWFGPGITWDLPVRNVKSSGLGDNTESVNAPPVVWIAGAAALAIPSLIGYAIGGSKGAVIGGVIGSGAIFFVLNNL